MVPPRVFPSSGFQGIPDSCLVDEETVPSYNPAQYFPARIGQVLNTHYQIISKVGFGTTSTVWLCRDLRRAEAKYKVVKILTKSASANGNFEVDALDHLKSQEWEHVGKQYVHIIDERFSLVSNDKVVHTCLVYEPLAVSLHDLRNRIQGKWPVQLLTSLVVYLLLGLDFLHSEAQLIHTDLQPKNILFSMKDLSVLTKVEEEELCSPVPRKILSDRTIYPSVSTPYSINFPVICDFGQTRFGNLAPWKDDIMPDLFRAPEVVLDLPWSYPVDIWGLGMLVWMTVYDEHLFHAQNSQGKLSNAHHLAEMIALMGMPPKRFLKGDRALKYFDEDGNWRGLVPIPKKSFEDVETRFEGECKELFLAFIRKTLKWDPAERPTASELWGDPWLATQWGDDVLR
ncbi:kinase-like protein [Atractiella rhizophila]|nr:kinase-like protein [Atractiella rhizophila]